MEMKKWVKITNRFNSREKRYANFRSRFRKYKPIFNFFCRLSDINFKRWDAFLDKNTIR